MPWLDTERDLSPFEPLWGALALGLGVAIFFVSSLWIAILVTIATVIVIGLLSDLIASIGIPSDARTASKRAVDAFRESYPECRFSNVALRAVESDRFVFSVRFDAPNGVLHEPQARRYFSVPRDNEATIVELNNRDWWPRGLK